MSINCDLILHWSATPGQLTALGAALWRWCNRAAGNTGIYQCLDNQALADLIAGRLPVSSQTERRGVHLWLRDAVSDDRQATIESLRRGVPAKGIEDIFVDGASWSQAELEDGMCVTAQRLTSPGHIRFFSNQQPRLVGDSN
jgi:hypothetical protein